MHSKNRQTLELRDCFNKQPSNQATKQATKQPSKQASKQSKNTCSSKLDVQNLSALAIMGRTGLNGL
jgi:hypothetical protein